ncbi:TetR/AcrR family transcriptional regulator [Shimwellia pseudoproteus]|uniref:TetR/AcrR family transcriptional regulator n=1 Tax=Shimwellia pseudoproteus TaxID=570012 RepID=UPI0018EA7023|nr:TetR/AcrR family transcriptional regulator [Shimwellia pseudoproteus]MBJ3814959.1 TetR/AcrR family transcriptional regulator [Shimwellia pseudoproteus]
MARHKAFDLHQALKRAIAVFAAHGFAGTSTAMLLNAMGISRQSLYDTFGDKRQLYLAALSHYSQESVSDILQHLEQASTARAGLEQALAAFTQRPADQGCMGVNAVCEFGISDRDITQATHQSGLRLATGLAHCIREGQQRGEFDPQLDPHSAAGYLMTLLSGLKVAARGGASEQALRQTLQIALRNL